MIIYYNLEVKYIIPNKLGSFYVLKLFPNCSNKKNQYYGGIRNAKGRIWKKKSTKYCID